MISPPQNKTLRLITNRSELAQCTTGIWETPPRTWYSAAEDRALPLRSGARQGGPPRPRLSALRKLWPDSAKRSIRVDEQE